MKNLLYIGAVACSLISWSHAFIYQAIVMRKWDGERQRYHWFIGLGDYHNRHHPATNKQLQQLHNLFAHVDRTSCKMFIEDLSAPNQEGRFACGNYYVNSRGGLLGGLTSVCRSYGIQAENVEYRYCRVCGLGPILNNVQADPYLFPSTCALHVADFVKEIDQECALIGSYDDGPALRRWYNQQVQAVRRKVAALNWHAQSRATVAQLVDCAEHKRLALVKKLLTFDSQLLDVKLVHAVVSHRAKERVCAIAGGSHIERVGKELAKIGYHPVFTSRPQYYQRDEIHHAIGSEQAVDTGMHPQPVALEQLSPYFF